jgi:hypothetical protein
MKFGQNPSRDVIERNCGKRGKSKIICIVSYKIYDYL